MQLTPEQINEFVAKSVLESQIGQAVQAAVKRSIEKLSQSYDNPFDSVIRSHVTQMIEDELKARYYEALKVRVKQKMETAITDDIMTRIVEAAVDKYKRY